MVKKNFSKVMRCFST